jgi:hypothetical protein
MVNTAFMILTVLFAFVYISQLTVPISDSCEFNLSAEKQDNIQSRVIDLTSNILASSRFVSNKSLWYDLSPVYSTARFQKKFSSLYTRRLHRRIHYYPNSMASFQLLLSAGDIELNPGPDSDSSSQQKNKQQRTSRSFSTICTECQKTVRKNQKRFVCDVCKDFIHASCLGVAYTNNLNSSQPQCWTCHKCVLSKLPFYGHDILETISVNSLTSDNDNDNDTHLNILNKHVQHLKIMHINTRSMVSTFDHLCLMIERYAFDIITMSETWLKENNLFNM